MTAPRKAAATPVPVSPQSGTAGGSFTCEWCGERFDVPSMLVAHLEFGCAWVGRT